MPSTRDIRQRIQSVKHIQQITRAMDMIAGVRLRRVQDRALDGRPYAERLAEILSEVVPSAGGAVHPLLERRPVRTAAIVAIAGERGLCGSYNADVMNRAEDVRGRRAGEGADVVFYVVGRKGIDSARRCGLAVKAAFPQPGIGLSAEDIQPIARQLIADYQAAATDRVDLVYTAFTSAARYGPSAMQLLPLEPPTGPPPPRRYRFEPAPAALLGRLLPLYVELSLCRALVESIAAEQAARKAAMHNASDSADRMIHDLTKTYNRRRQNSITTEILEVVAGAEVLLHEGAGR